jgi:FixJ family two-component response regulator
VDFVEIPHPQSQIRAAIANALAGLRTRHEHARKADRARRRLGEFTQREREVLVGLLTGKPANGREPSRECNAAPRRANLPRVRPDGRSRRLSVSCGKAPG